jgi:hypothetical protein
MEFLGQFVQPKKQPQSISVNFGKNLNAQNEQNSELGLIIYLHNLLLKIILRVQGEIKLAQR